MAKFNPVAKFSRMFNNAVVITDKKREYKKTGDLGRRCNYDDDFYDSADGYINYEESFSTTQDTSSPVQLDTKKEI